MDTLEQRRDIASAGVRSLRDLRAPTLVLLMTVLGLGVSAAILFGVVPGIITRAYRGESLSLLNSMIRGQTSFPVEHYLQVWRDICLRVLRVEATLGLLLAVLSWPVVQRGVDRLLGQAATPTGSEAFRMSRGQLVVANCVVFTLLGLQIFDLSLQREDWPFSNYPMYAAQQTERYAWIRVYGVAETGEFPLVPERQLGPWDTVRINYSFSSSVLHPVDHSASSQRALQNLYSLYEAGRRAGEHNGPALHALRLYREQWRVEPGLGNKTTPEERQLIYEIDVAD